MNAKEKIALAESKNPKLHGLMMSINSCRGAWQIYPSDGNIGHIYQAYVILENEVERDMGRAVEGIRAGRGSMAEAVDAKVAAEKFLKESVSMSGTVKPGTLDGYGYMKATAALKEALIKPIQADIEWFEALELINVEATRIVTECLTRHESENSAKFIRKRVKK